MAELDSSVAFSGGYGAAGCANIVTTTTSNTNKTAATFKKGIKRDLVLFSVFKENNQLDSWKRNLIAIARAQNVDEVLDSSYSLVTIEKNELFDEKKNSCILFLIEF